MTNRNGEEPDAIDGAAAEPTIRIRERATERTARYAIIGANPSQAARIWFVLHGYGMLASRFARAFDGIVPPDTCIVAPEALSRFYIEMPRPDGGHLQKVGATWLTRESRNTEIADAHRWLDAVHDEVVHESTSHRGVPPVTAVLGFSQGVATAMRWIAEGRVDPLQFVAWAGGLAQDVDREKLFTKMAHRHVHLVFGEQDEFATDIAKASIAAAVAALGVPHTITSFDGGHHLDVPLLTTILETLIPSTS